MKKVAKPTPRPTLTAVRTLSATLDHIRASTAARQYSQQEYMAMTQWLEQNPELMSQMADHWDLADTPSYIADRILKWDTHKTDVLDIYLAQRRPGYGDGAELRQAIRNIKQMPTADQMDL